MFIRKKKSVTHKWVYITMYKKNNIPNLAEKIGVEDPEFSLSCPARSLKHIAFLEGGLRYEKTQYSWNCSA